MSEHATSGSDDDDEDDADADADVEESDLHNTLSHTFLSSIDMLRMNSTHQTPQHHPMFSVLFESCPYDRNKQNHRTKHKFNGEF